jgi:hypothetical protein
MDALLVSTTQTIDNWAHVWQSAEHEAAHGSALHHYGWHADAIWLRPDGGDIFFRPAEVLDHVTAELQRCVCLAAATAHAGEKGGLYDRIEVFRRTRALAHSRDEHEYLRRLVEYDAIQLVAKPSFRARVSRVATALIEHGGHLEGRELKLLLAEPAPRLRPRAAWPPPDEWTDEMLDEHEQHVREHFPLEWEAWLAEQEAVADHQRLVNRARAIQASSAWGGRLGQGGAAA